MAATLSMGSCLTRSAQCFGTENRVYSFFLLRQQSRSAGAFLVRCQTKDEPSEKSASVSSTLPPATPKVSTKFSDVLAFSGPAPERINGRLAMIGFVAAVAVEAASGNDLAVQLSSGGLPWFFYVSALLSAASLVPLFQGVTADSKSGKLMSSNAELWNGRLAMLGLVALAFTEYFKGGPLV